MRFLSSLIGLAVGLLPMGAAFADGIELPRRVQKTMGGNYVIRSVIVTNNAVTDLQYGLFDVLKDGRIGEQVSDAVFRPAVLNTQPGQKQNLLLSFDGTNINSEQLKALCMWSKPPVGRSEGPSQLLAAFRYCKLFTVVP